MPVDYNSIASKYGGTTIPTNTGNNFSSIASKYGGTTVNQVPKYDPRTDTSNQQMIEAEKNAFTQPSTFAGVMPDIKGIANAITDYAVKAPLKFGLSLGEIANNPKSYLQGIASGQNYNVPGIGDVQSIQSEYQKSLQNGANPSDPFTFVKPEIQTFSGAAPLFGAGKVIGDIPLTGENAGEFQPGSIQKSVESLMNKGVSDQFNSVLKSTTPKVTPRVGAEAISNAGKPGGAISTGLGTSTIQPTANDLQRASDVMPFYDKDPIKFATNINQGITDVSKNVEDYLNANPTQGDPEELLSRINAVEAPKLASSDQATAIERVKDIAKELINPTDAPFTSDKVLSRLNDIVGPPQGAGISIPDSISSTNPELAMKVRGLANDLVTQEISPSNFESVLRDNLTPAEQKILDTPTLGSPQGNITRTSNDILNTQKLIQQENPLTNTSLWDTRKIFDDRIDAAKNAIVDPEKLKALNIATSNIRSEWNNYIAEITPGGKEFTNQMSTLHNMYDALDNLGDNYGKTVGVPLGKILSNAHPNIAKALKIAKIGTIAGGVGTLAGAGYKLFNWLTNK